MATIIHSRNKSLEQQLVEAAGDFGLNQDQKTHNNQKEEELSAKLQTLQEDFERKEDQLKALNSRLVRAVAEKVENLMRLQELEDNVRLQTQDNLDLQEKLLHSLIKMRFGSQNSQYFHTELLSDIAGLKELMATIESSWEEEKDKLLKAVRSEREVREQAQNDLRKIIDTWRCTTQEKNREIIEAWQKAHEQHDLTVKYLQEESDRKVNQVVLEKDDLISLLTEDKKALEVLVLENKAQLKEMKEQLIQSEAEWKTKLAALEDQLKSKEKVETTSEEMEAKKEELKRLIKERKVEDKREQKVTKKREREGRRGEKNVRSCLSSLFK